MTSSEKERRALVSSDEVVFDVVCALVELHLNGAARRDAVQWLEQRHMAYRAMDGLGLCYPDRIA
jgi:hypothetical protein